MATEEFYLYVSMCLGGATPREVYLQAKTDGLGDISCVRLLRAVFSLSLIEAKEIVVTVSGRAKSLLEHQANLAPALWAALDILSAEEESPA